MTAKEKSPYRLAICRVKIKPQFRSPSRPPNGIRCGWHRFMGRGYHYFLDDEGWSWGSAECSVKIIKQSRRLCWPSAGLKTPRKWQAQAKRMGFKL